MDEKLTRKEQLHRKALADKARQVILDSFPVEDADETSLMLIYEGFYLQISFTEIHPLMVFYLARAIEQPASPKKGRLVNELNLKSVLGCHTLNGVIGCYSYRAAHWLDIELSESRIVEMLSRCCDEAKRAFEKLAGVC